MKIFQKNASIFDKLKYAGFLLAIMVIVYLLTFLTHSPDYDLWARLAVGSVFFQTGSVLHHDIFSYLPTKTHWIDHEWGASVIFYGFVKYFGEVGIFILKAVIILLILLLIIQIIKLQTNKKHTGVFYLIFLGFSLFPGVASVIRCQMFTYLFFTLWLYLLERIRHNSQKKFLWLFPFTMLIWVNLHGGFVTGIGLVVIYIMGELLNRRSPIPYLKIILMILPVTLITPYGFEFWKYIIGASLMPRPGIPEWHAISLNGPLQIICGMKVHFLAGFMVLALLTIATVIKQIIKKIKPDWTKYLLFAILLYLGIKHQRHVVFFVIAASALFYNQYLNLFNPLNILIEKVFVGKYQKIWTVAKYSLGYLFLFVVFVSLTPFLCFKLDVNPKEYPYGSFEFIKQNNISGNLATTFTWSSYAFWKLYPQCKVLIDGRYEEVYPDTVFDEAMLFSQKSGKWDAVLNKYHTDIIVLPKSLYQPVDLQLIPDWDVAYQDFVSVVLLPKNKMKPDYVRPDYKNAAYLKEDFSKEIHIVN